MHRITIVLLSVVAVFLAVLLALCAYAVYQDGSRTQAVKTLAAAIAPPASAPVVVVEVGPTLQQAGTDSASSVASTEAPDWEGYCAGRAAVHIVSQPARRSDQREWPGPACGPGVHAFHRPWQSESGAPAAGYLDPKAGWWSYFASWEALAASIEKYGPEDGTAWFIPGVVLSIALTRPVQAAAAVWVTGEPEEVCAGQPMGVGGLGDTEELPPSHPAVPVTGPAVVHNYENGEPEVHYVYYLRPGQQDAVTLPGRVWVYSTPCAQFAEIDWMILVTRLYREDPTRQLVLEPPAKG